jgi:hypothetical protein
MPLVHNLCNAPLNLRTGQQLPPEGTIAISAEDAEVLKDHPLLSFSEPETKKDEPKPEAKPAEKPAEAKPEHVTPEAKPEPKPADKPAEESK